MDQSQSAELVSSVVAAGRVLRVRGNRGKKRGVGQYEGGSREMSPGVSRKGQSLTTHLSQKGGVMSVECSSIP